MKLLLLDKDGTLVQTVSGENFVQAPWDQKPIDGAVEMLSRWVADGWTPVIISNQDGILHGHKSLEETRLEMRYAMGLFPSIKEALFCPNNGDSCWRVWGNCRIDEALLYGVGHVDYPGLAGTYRKPGGGMIKLACDLHEADQVFFVGDFVSDMEAALATGTDFLLIDDWLNLKELP